MATKEDDWDLALSNLTDFDNLIQRDKIFASKIPKNMTKDGLYNLFSQYGTIKDIHMPINKDYVFITYTSIA